MIKDKDKGQKGGGAMAQPMDPPQAGLTTSSANRTSATPNDTPKDDTGRRLPEELQNPDDSPGEQSISGSTSDPTSDDDIQKVAHAVGEQLDEDEEHPQPVDIAHDVDEAEKEHREN